MSTNSTSDRFPNLYWSIDYVTGLNNLKSQSFKSLKQLHELRKLVFNYMTYYHANSEFLNKSSIDLFPVESTFLPFEYNPRSVSNTPTTSPYRKRIVSNETTVSKQETTTPKHETTMTTAYSEYIDYMSQESTILLNLTSIIDRDVLQDITMYLKYHEPKIHQQFTRLDEVYNNYLKSYKNIERLKSRHIEQLRLKEFSQSQVEQTKSSPEETVEDQLQHSSSFEESYADEDLEDEEIDNTFDLSFPLHIGTVVVSSAEELQLIMNQLITKVPITMRKIPLPGYKNEIFNSESISKVLLTIPIKGFKPSRLNIEKFGQGLLDLKLMTSSNFFNKKFKSEGMWFEWSDLAVYFAQFKSSLAASSVKDTSSIGSNTTSTTNKSSAISSPKNGRSKFISDMAETTTRFNAMFNNVRSSILKTNHAEILEDIEDSYNEEILNLQEFKYLLENGLFDLSQYLEKFEKMKIEIIYKSLSRLLEILLKFQKEQTTKLEAFSNNFIRNINKSENYLHDFNKTMEHFSTGIYFPSVITPDTNVRSTSIGTNYQNLKYQFDLYKDIPLQLQNNFNSDNESLLSIASIPYILYQTIKIIEERSNDNVEVVRKLWMAPIEYQSQWRIKQDIIQLVADYTPDLKNDISNKYLIEQEFCNQVLKHLKAQKTNDVIIFVKNWLLEISDSIIPFVIFDSLMNLYNQENVAAADLIKLLSTIPRSNLASLIYVIEYFGNLFALGSIPNYEISDELPEESLLESIEEASIVQVSNELNSMDTIGSIPIMHLILRPSTSKNSTGFKPPLDKYKRIMVDILKLDVRTELLKHLIEHEINYKSKKEAEKLQVKKIPVSVPVPVPVSESESPQTPPQAKVDSIDRSTPAIVHPQPTQPNKQKRPESAEFTLRPFRTRPTPVPSPQSSPKRGAFPTFTGSLSSGASTTKLPTPPLSQPTTTNQLLPAASHHTNRGRSLSNSFITPRIEIEFEN